MDVDLPGPADLARGLARTRPREHADDARPRRKIADLAVLAAVGDVVVLDAADGHDDARGRRELVHGGHRVDRASVPGRRAKPKGLEALGA